MNNFMIRENCIMCFVGFLTAFVVCLYSMTADCLAGEGESTQGASMDFTTFTLEELIDYEVTTVSKKPEKISQTAAAVFVVTSEDIRRSGSTTLPDVLRMVPGIQVARSDPGDFAVTARGFVGEFANKLLVLIDGRNIYSSLSAGVFWDLRDMPLEDIDRIEVVRGPGATMWGANAVNGVINIITKNSRNTQGWFAYATVGNTHEYYEGIRYGGRANDNLYYRLYAKHIQFGAVDNQLRNEPHYVRSGFRIDWSPSADNTFYFTGDYFNGSEKFRSKRIVISQGPRRITAKTHGRRGGLHLLGNWTHTFSPDSEMSLKVFIDTRYVRAKRYPETEVLKDKSDLARESAREYDYDIDFQHRFSLPERHKIIWGLKFNLSSHSKDTVSYLYNTDPRRRYTHLYSAYLQDEYELIPDCLKLIAGSKFENNSFTNFEFQPSARLLWIPGRRHSFWAAVSRAVRTPSIYEHNARIRLAILPGKEAVTEWVGDDGFDSEKLIAYEIGYRFNLPPYFNFDTAAFYNRYKELRTLEPGSPQFAKGYIRLPLNPDNNMEGESYGLELTTNYQAAKWWRLQASFTWMQMNLDTKTRSWDASATNIENLSPSTMLSLRSLINITPDLDFDASVYFTDDIPGLGIKRYTNLILRIAWRPVKNLEISIIGHNLLDNRHNEFSDELFADAENEVLRSFFTRIAWQF